MDEEMQMEPIWTAATELKQGVMSLTLSNEEKHLLLQTIYLELRILYLQEDLVSGYEFIEGLNDEVDRLIHILLDTMESLYEMKDMLDLEEILGRLELLWLQK